MTNEYEFITGPLSEVKQQSAPILCMIVGNKGSGKNTLLAFIAWCEEMSRSTTKTFSNTKIANSYYIPDVVQWLAIKIINEESSVCNFFIDEAAIAGFEARGSQRESRALDSYTLTLSRKATANVFIATQLISMIEKRGQWIADIYIYCESVYEDGPMPASFQYTVFDKDLKEINDFSISGDFARQVLYRRYITEQVPFPERLKKDFTEYYSITDEHVALYEEIMGIHKVFDDTKKEHPEFKEFNHKRSLAIGALLVIEEKHYTVQSRAFDTEQNIYRYLAKETPME